MKLKKLDSILKELFQIDKIKDPSLNGIQIEGSTEISNLGFAVDVNDYIIEKTIENNIDVLIVHHGLFWGKEYRIKGVMKNRVKKLLENDITLYAIHLPLDIHEELGNNRYLYDKMDLRNREMLVDFGGFPMGFIGHLPNKTKYSKIENYVEKEIGEIKHKIVSHKMIEKVGILSGDPKSMLDGIFEADFDLLLSGEVTHEIYFRVLEKDISAVFVGHYRSEVGGVKLLQNYIEKNYRSEIDNTYFFEFDSGL